MPWRVADRPVAQQQAADIDRQDAAAADGAGQGEDHQAAGHRQQRIEAVGHRQTVDQLQQQPAAEQAEHGADAELLQQAEQEIPAKGGLAGEQHLDQCDGQEHRHRVVAARFDFQGRADPLVEALAVEQVEHHRGIRGADDGADQQALQQRQVEQPGGGQPGQARGDGDPEGGQGKGRFQRDAEGGGAGAHAAVEQDHRQRQVADDEGEAVVLEDDAADAIDASEHADGKEDDQDGYAEAIRQRTHQDACSHQQGTDEEQVVDVADVQMNTPLEKAASRPCTGYASDSNLMI